MNFSLLSILSSMSPLMIYYFGLHIFLYFCVVYFFGIIGKAKIYIALVFILLSSSFIVAIALSRTSNSIFTKYFYAISAFWTGMLAIFATAFIVTILINIFIRQPELKQLLGITSIILPLILGLYGVWNAFNPIIKNIEVEIPNLPKQWEGKKIVQISDAHLGKINGVSFAEKIVKEVNAVKPDLILITGDLFDGIGSNVSDFVNTLNKLNANDGVYFVTGNHEVYLGADYVISQLKNTKIHVLNNESVILNGLQIIGVSYPEFGETRKADFLAGVMDNNPNLTNILMYHSPTSTEQNHTDEASQRSSIYFMPDTNFAIAEKDNINLQLSGHTHDGQLFPYNLLVRYIYKGDGYGLKTFGDFNIYTTSGIGTWGPPMRIGTQSEIPVITLKSK